MVFPIPFVSSRFATCCIILAIVSGSAIAQDSKRGFSATQRVVVGDPQLRTDHPWFPGELSCSTFDRLFATQAELYKRVTGRTVSTDEDKAIASWYWRNLNFYHNFSPRERLWNTPLKADDQDNESVAYEYWAGLFSYGFALCGTTHAQYTAEMEQLLGHCRARAVDVSGHTSFEVFLKDPVYGPKGDWALLDHDISTVVFQESERGERLANLWQIAFSSPAPIRTPRPVGQREAILDNSQAPSGNRGWYKAGLYYPKDNADATNSDTIGCYTQVTSLAPLSGYASAPPMIALRRNEVLRRYFQPGLEDKSYVFWGANMNLGGIPGPCRDRTWACEPERMFQATRDTETASVARYGNAVFTYQPVFSNDTYRDAVVSEDEQSVTFQFSTPYAIAATPPASHAEDRWGLYEQGCTSGLVISATDADCTVQFSSNHGTTWSEPAQMTGRNSVDWTDLAKSLHSYRIRLNASTDRLATMGFTFRAVCIANDRLMPHLRSQGTRVQFSASNRAVFSAGPNVDQAEPFITGGGFGQEHVEMTIPIPGSQPLLELYASAQVFSRSPADDRVTYTIDYSVDQGRTWQPIVEDWQIKQHGYQIDDHHSKTFCYGMKRFSDEHQPPTDNTGSIVVRFRNDGGITYRRTEAHLVCSTPKARPVQVTYGWTEGTSVVERTASHVFSQDEPSEASDWNLSTGDNVSTRWVELKLAE